MPLALDTGHHWVVPFAAVGAAFEPPALPNLQALLERLRESARDAGEDTGFAMPHERVLARSRGVATDSGSWPGAALHSAEAHTPQAWVHPVHLQVGMGEVTLQAAELFGLDEATSRALFDAIAPLCAEDGVALHFDHPTRWRASGERLRGLRCASLDRVTGRSLAAWLPQGDEARWLQRLMSEAQMLFYTHPVNDVREAARLLPVNGLWFSAAGAVDSATAPGPAPQVDQRLRANALRGDAAAWRADWLALDSSLIAELLARARRGEAFTLTLCGERAALSLAPAAPSAWQRLARTLRLAPGANAHELLKTL
jgi:hypothetical protein